MECQINVSPDCHLSTPQCLLGPPVYWFLKYLFQKFCFMSLLHGFDFWLFNFVYYFGYLFCVSMLTFLRFFHIRRILIGKSFLLYWKCRSFSFSKLLHRQKFCIIKIYRSFSFSELLTGRNFVNKICRPFSFLKIVDQHKFDSVLLKYASYLVFSELLTGRNSFTRMWRSFSFSLFVDWLLVMQILRFR